MIRQFSFQVAVLLISFCVHGPSLYAQIKQETKELNFKKKDYLAKTPPMGWNSWDCLGWGATEKEIKEVADYMSKNLKKLGYEYIVIDMLWYGDEKAINFEDFIHERIPSKPNYNIDNYGRLLPDTTRFPSSKNGNGFKSLAQYIHKLGLKFGVHMLRGIPWQAADGKLIIKGTDITANTIADETKGCEWYDGFYGVDMNKKGSQEYYNSVYELLAEWDVDFVKIDDVVNEAELKGISTAIGNTNRDIVISVVPDGISMDTLKKYSHMARTGSDFWDVWEMLKRGFRDASSVSHYAALGFWPDLDMLPIGKLGKKISYKGPYERISKFNKNELQTLFTLWYISRAPLFIGGYLPETDSYTLELLNNRQALAVNRNSINNRQIKFKNAIVIWTADIPGSEDKYVAFFNQWESLEPVNIKLKFSEIGYDSLNYKVTDLWKNRDIGTFKSDFSFPVNAHGAALFRISKARK